MILDSFPCLTGSPLIVRSTHSASGYWAASTRSLRVPFCVALLMNAIAIGSDIIRLTSASVMTNFRL